MAAPANLQGVVPVVVQMAMAAVVSGTLAAVQHRKAPDAVAEPAVAAGVHQKAPAAVAEPAAVAGAYHRKVSVAVAEPGSVLHMWGFGKLPLKKVYNNPRVCEMLHSSSSWMQFSWCAQLSSSAPDVCSRWPLENVSSCALDNTSHQTPQPTGTSYRTLSSKYNAPF